MNTQQRDHSLDIIKGFCCLLMVIAHLPFYFQQSDLSLGIINHLTSLFTPVLFFAIAGVTASLQLRKYSFNSLMLYFTVMFFLGFSWNLIIHGNISAYYWPEIFQFIAIGSILICIVERNGPLAHWQLLGLAALLLGLKPIIDRVLPNFDGWNYIVCDNAYVANDGSNEGEQIILPGFPLLPWSGYFILGIWCYRANRSLKLAMAIGSLILVITLTLLGMNPIEKWDTSLPYALSGCVVVCSFFWLFHHGITSTGWLTDRLRNIGNNTFLFFFSHPIGLVAGAISFIFLENAYIAWFIALSVSMLAYTLFSRIKPMKIFQSPLPWLIIIAILLLLPFTTLLIEHEGIAVLNRILAMAIGIVCAANFASLSLLIKVRKSASVNNPAPFDIKAC